MCLQQDLSRTTPISYKSTSTAATTQNTRNTPKPAAAPNVQITATTATLI